VSVLEHRREHPPHRGTVVDKQKAARWHQPSLLTQASLLARWTRSQDAGIAEFSCSDSLKDKKPQTS
jgi:hypothetical protein